MVFSTQLRTFQREYIAIIIDSLIPLFAKQLEPENYVPLIKSYI
jgi:hypothetical protein